MPENIINLLSDKVANQIAAGEVVQRPSSVVKELLENSLDSGADTIQLIVKDAGKTLIQVIDNGCGMNEIDARMSFERHATSKISKAEDLFKIVTMGFRGEALASIASVAQVEMKSRIIENEIGTELRIEGSKVINQSPCQCSTGTSISVKNLFYNIPARRNFLKSNTIEMKHIYDEFHRVAIANPEIKFILIENGVNRFSLEKANLKQRIVQIFGASYQKKLVAVDQSTDYLKVWGFLIKPEFSKKTRGEQFIFVNNRFIKSFSLHKVISETYKNYISSDMVPGYFLFFQINPEEIDVNVHPTKTEIKFKNDYNISLILKSSLNYAIGSFNIAPSIDFDVEPTVTNIPPFDPSRPVKMPEITFNPNYNPFKNSETNFKQAGFQMVNFTDLIDSKNDDLSFELDSNETDDKQLSFDDKESVTVKPGFLFGNLRYLITLIKSGIMIVDTVAARERIVFEQTKDVLSSAKICSSQQLLFPETFELQHTESDILIEILPELDSIGFNISNLGNNTFSCSSTPIEWDESNQIIPFIEQVIDSYQFHLLDAKKEKNTAIALAMSKKTSQKPIFFHSNEEMNIFIEQLFSTPMPEHSPSGNKTYWVLEYSELSKILSKS